MGKSKQNQLAGWNKTWHGNNGDNNNGFEEKSWEN